MDTLAVSPKIALLLQPLFFVYHRGTTPYCDKNCTLLSQAEARLDSAAEQFTALRGFKICVWTL